MTCDECRMACYDLIDQTLGEKDVENLHGHIEACPACRAFLEEEGMRTRKWARLLQSEVSSVSMPPDAIGRVAHSLEVSCIGRSGRRQWSFPFASQPHAGRWRRIAAAAAFVAGAVAVAAGIGAAVWFAATPAEPRVSADGVGVEAIAVAPQDAEQPVAPSAITEVQSTVLAQVEDAAPIDQAADVAEAGLPPEVDIYKEEEATMKNTNNVAAVAVAVSLAGSLALANTFSAVSGNDWNTPENWSDGVPLAGQDVVIAGAVMLTNSTPALTSLTVNSGASVTFDGWGTLLTADAVAVYGTVTHAQNADVTAADGWTPNARVNISCTTLDINATGKIDVDGKGFKGGPAVKAETPGYGPGAGSASTSSRGSGAGHGGPGGRGGLKTLPESTTDMPGGLAYGSADEPTLPGSGGGGGQAGTSAGGNGGGAVYISATGAVLLNGSITANGSNGGNNTSGGGSGGSIYLSCETIAGAGVIGAAGGMGATGNGTTGGGGAGGRIAVLYSTASQASAALPQIAFTARGGNVSHLNGYVGDVGSLYFPDSQFLTRQTGPIVHCGQWEAPGFDAWERDSLTIAGGWLRFPTPGFVLNVTNGVSILGGVRDLVRLELTNGVFACGGDMTVSNGTFTAIGGSAVVGGNVLATTSAAFAFRATETSGPTFHGEGAMTLTNGATFEVRSAATAFPGADYGALVEVDGALSIAATSWIYPHSNPTNGVSPIFRASSLNIGIGGGFDASYKGFSYKLGGNGYGPGGGFGSRSGGGGGGHGGFGGLYSGAYGQPNGSYSAPILPGSAGGCGNGATTFGGHGGGVVRIEVAGAVVLDGGLYANGMYPVSYPAGGGAGGSVYVECETIQGAGTVSASGGNGFGAGGGGGGGRIAVMYDTVKQAALPLPAIQYIARPGARGGDTGPATFIQVGDVGSLYFPDSQALVRLDGTFVHSGEWMAPGIGMLLELDSLAMNEAWLRFPVSGFKLDVAGEVTVSGTDPLLHKLEFVGGSLTCADAMLVNKSSVNLRRGTQGIVELLCGGDLDLVNQAQMNIESISTNGLATAYGALVDVGGGLSLAGSSWIYPASDSVSDGSAVFRAVSVQVEDGSGFNASGLGYKGAGVPNAYGYGPGRGFGSGNGSGGAGHGGLGGLANATSGLVNGLAHAPLAPGSGGGHTTGGAGGGVVWIESARLVHMNGSLIADGANGGYRGGGGAGGGILVACTELRGSGVMRASAGLGGDGSGGGGGGRIAIWEGVAQPYSAYRLKDATVESGLDAFTGTVSVPGGGTVTGIAHPGEAGTIMYLSMWPQATLIILR